MTNIGDLTQDVFTIFVQDGQIDILQEDDEVQIIADDWTIVLQGDPLRGVIVALDDETGDPIELLRAMISDHELGTLHDLDAQLQGALATQLAKSPDPLANALGRLVVQA